MELPGVPHFSQYCWKAYMHYQSGRAEKKKGPWAEYLNQPGASLKVDMNNGVAINTKEWTVMMSELEEAKVLVESSSWTLKSLSWHAEGQRWDTGPITTW